MLCMQLAKVPQAEKTERLQWVHDMRSAFSPAAMLAEDGSINQEFFKPSKVIHLAIISASCTSVLLAPYTACCHRWYWLMIRSGGTMKETFCIRSGSVISGHVVWCNFCNSQAAILGQPARIVSV